MSRFLLYIIMLLAASTSIDVFAAPKTSTPEESSGGIFTGSITSDVTENTNTGGLVETNTEVIPENDAAEKEKEQTINDINTFLIESYKLKIDKILANLNISLERITNNDPVAQAQLLEKIRKDIDTKIQVINSRSISENRKKILSSVFSYIQENLSAKISKLVREK